MEKPEGDGEGPEGVDAENEKMARMSTMSTEDVMRAGHELLLRRLVAKIGVGTASHQEMAILRNLLRDNGMMLDVYPNKTIQELPSAIGFGIPMPLLPEPDYDE